MGVSIVFSFFTTRILLQALGASDYGLYNVVAGSLSMLGFLSASMCSTTQRFISYAEGEGNLEKIKTIFNNALFLHNAIAAIVGLFFILAGFVFFNGVLNIPEGRNVVAIAVYGCMIFSTVFAVTIVPYDAVLNAHENMKFYSILGIVDVLLKFIIALVVMFTKSLDQLLFYGVLMAAESWLYRFLTKRYCIRQYEEVREPNRKKYVEKSALKEMTSFAGWNMLNISSGMISLYGMGVVLNHFFGSTVNASLGIAQQLAGVLLGVSSNMTKAMTPALVKMEGAKERNQMIDLSIVGCKYSYLLFAFFSIPVACCLSPLLGFWLNIVPEWTEEFCLLIFLATMIEQFFLFLYNSINAQGNVKMYHVTRFVTNLLPIIVTSVEFYIGYPPYYALINWVIFKALLGGLVNLYYAHNNFAFPIYRFFRKVVIPLIASTLVISLFCLIIKPVDGDPLWKVVIELLLMILFSIPLYWFIALNVAERNNVKHIINRIITL